MPKFVRRESWVDVAKGLLMLMVVAGHSNHMGHAVKYIYWFHMPAFFVLSGYLFKPPADWPALLRWARKRAQRLLIPYLSFLALITLYRYDVAFAHGYVNLAWLVKDILHIAAGGRYIGGVYTTFWFITCLYTTQLAFAIIILRVKSTNWRLMIIGAAYLLAHLEASVSPKLVMPWNVDVILIALAYHAFGFFARPFFLHKAVSILAILGAGALVVGNTMGFFDYRLNLKYLGYTNPAMDLVIPVVLTTALCAISRWCVPSPLERVLVRIGITSLPIMYLHILVNNIIHGFFDYGVFLYTLFGITVPAALALLLIERFQITRILFLGLGGRGNKAQGWPKATSPKYAGNAD